MTFTIDLETWFVFTTSTFYVKHVSVRYGQKRRKYGSDIDFSNRFYVTLTYVLEIWLKVTVRHFFQVHLIVEV